MEATTVRASYKDKSFLAQFLTEDIPEILRSMEGVHIGDAKRYVIRVLTSDYGDRHMAVTLLWLACQGDQGTHAKAEALKGGATIEYRLTDADDLKDFFYLSLIVHESLPRALYDGRRRRTA